MTEEPQYSIAIEFEDFLTRFDLDYVIYAIDRMIDGDEPQERHYLEDDFEYFYPHRFPPYSYVGITSIRRGSVILSVIISSAVSAYVSKRFYPQFREGRVSEQIKRSAKLSDDALGSVLEKINDYFEKFVPIQRERGGNIKSVKIGKKRKRVVRPKEKSKT